MKKIKKGLIYLITVIALFLVDFGLTWHFLDTSTYVNEGNPLTDFGALSLSINILYAISVFVIGYFAEKYPLFVTEAKNSFDYTKKLFRTDRYDFMIISFLTAFVYSTFASRMVAIIDWLVFGLKGAEFNATKYAILRSKMPFGKFDLVVTLIVFVIAVPLWYKSQFVKSKKSLKRQ